jgi:potassium efflux system protein
MAIEFRPFQRIATLSCLLILSTLLTVFPSIVQGQLPVDKVQTPSVESGPERVETSEHILERLQQLQSRARQSLSGAQPVLDATPPEQLGATTDEVKEKQLLLFTRVFLYEKHIESIRNLEETRRAREDLASKSEAWQGFDQSPPYPISLVDELRDAIHAQSLAVAKEDVRKSLTLQGQNEAREALHASEKSLRKIKESLEQPLEGTDQIRTNWLYELAQLKNEVAEANVLATRAQLQAIEESLSLHNKQQKFHDRQLQIAVADAPFGEEELEQKLAALANNLKINEENRRQSIRDNNRNQEKLHRARITLQQARESLVLQGDIEKQNEEINYLQNVVETRKAQADTSSQMVELLKLWIIGINGEKLLWEDRYHLASSRDETTLTQASESLKKRLERIRENRYYIESSLKLAQNLISNEQQRLTAGTLAEKERILVLQKLDAYKKQTEFTTKLLVYTNVLTRNVERFQEEVAYYRPQVPVGEQLHGFFGRSMTVVENIWNYELFAVEDTIFVDGQPVTAQRPVTISKVARALLILILGFWLTTLLKFRVSGLASKLFKIDKSSALLIEKFLQSIAVFTLLVFALITVKIPLTAFAFMGGALALGVGFGTQTLINNFISGIILLFERPIKAGDLVEVEGIKGRVVSIGLRCSQVKRSDGIDILVPNSDFMQKNVVNWTLSDQLIRQEVKLGVAYGSPTREVARVITNALNEHGKILKEPEPTILFEDFADSALIFSVDFWVEVLPTFDYRIIASDLRHMLDKRLREADIAIALPQLDVHLDSSKPAQLKMLEKLDELSANKTPASKTTAESED